MKEQLKGYTYADGVHWYMGDTEVAVIDPETAEIEWCVRKVTLPQDVIDAVRAKKPAHNGKWIVEARRVDISATQGEIVILVDDREITRFADTKVIGDDGQYHSKYSDDELGRFVASAFWHPLDNVYHISDQAKNAFSGGTSIAEGM
jgi:hypothetical protein